LDRGIRALLDPPVGLLDPARQPDPGPPDAPRLMRLALVVILGAGFYGLIMGSYSVLPADRLLLSVYAAIKAPLLLGVTFILALPSFYVVNSLLGLRDDFGHVLRALLATQAGVALVLASLAPLTAWWYISVRHYEQAIIFNLGMFAVAAFAGQLLLRRGYRPLIARQPRHRVLLRVWLGIYAFIAVQMAWVLRPFIGHPEGPRAVLPRPSVYQRLRGPAADAPGRSRYFGKRLNRSYSRTG
jgi:hypothetical protein